MCFSKCVGIYKSDSINELPYMYVHIRKCFVYVCAFIEELPYMHAHIWKRFSYMSMLPYMCIYKRASIYACAHIHKWFRKCMGIYRSIFVNAHTYTKSLKKNSNLSKKVVTTRRPIVAKLLCPILFKRSTTMIFTRLEPWDGILSSWTWFRFHINYILR